MAEIIRYVDTDSAGGNGTTSALSGTDAAYATLAACIAAEKGDWVTAANWLHIYCKASAGAADTTAVVIADADWVTSDASHILIEAVESDKAGASWSTSKYRLETNNAHAFHSTNEFIRFKYLQMGLSAVAGHDLITCRIALVGTNPRFYAEGCLLKGPGGTTYRAGGFHFEAGASSGGAVYMWNCAAYNYPGYLYSDLGALWISLSNTTSYIYNCVFHGGRVACYVAGTSSTIYTKNVYAHPTAASNQLGFKHGGGTFAKTNCAASDASATATGTNYTATNCIDSVAYSAATFANVTGGSEDLHLAGTGSGLYRTGVDTSGDAAPMNFTTDIDGDAYYDTGGARSIGVDEYVVAATNVVMNIV